jgi:hypothetical protein
MLNSHMLSQARLAGQSFLTLRTFESMTGFSPFQLMSMVFMLMLRGHHRQNVFNLHVCRNLSVLKIKTSVADSG